MKHPEKDPSDIEDLLDDDIDQPRVFRPSLDEAPGQGENTDVNGIRTKSPGQTPPDKIPRTKSPGQNPPDKIPLDKIPPRTKSPQDKIPLDKIPPVYFIDSNIFY